MKNNKENYFKMHHTSVKSSKSLFFTKIMFIKKVYFLFQKIVNEHHVSVESLKFSFFEEVMHIAEQNLFY